MIKLCGVSKKYLNGDLFYNYALEDINIVFDDNKLVSIIGESGAGKSSLLSVVGGLCDCSSGEVYFDDVCINNLDENELASYRSNYVGFIFQSYNLFDDLTVFDNVKLSDDLNNYKDDDEIYRLLDTLGLANYVNSYPKNLSGGERQRVAIARAIIKKPKILLCDEPTGALDVKNGEAIMKILKDLSKDCLVIVVTHDKRLAKKYSDRVVELSDGKVISDSNSILDVEAKNTYSKEKNHMSIKGVMKLSLMFIKSKKKRVFFLMISQAICVFSLILVCELSRGFNKKINNLNTDMASSYPVVVSEYVTNYEIDNKKQEDNLIKKEQASYVHHNVMTNKLDTYIRNISFKEIRALSYKNPYYIPIFIKKNGKVIHKNISDYLYSVPYNGEEKLTFEQYDLVAGKDIEKYNEVLLVVSSNNTISTELCKELGLDLDSYKYEDILSLNFKLGFYDNYIQIDDDVTFNADLAYDKGIDLKIVGIVKAKEDYSFNYSSVLLCDEDLFSSFLKFNKDNLVLEYQKNSDVNVLNKDNLSTYEKSKLLSKFTYTSFSLEYLIYPVDYSSKKRILNYLDSYLDSKIIVNDSINLVTDVSKVLVDIISFVMLFFSILSFVVMLIMIGVIFYINIIEKKQEIWILRYLGARCKNVKMIFNLEAILIGVFSGIFGILLAFLLFKVFNKIIFIFTSISDVLEISIFNGVLFVIFSILITLVGSYFPVSKLSFGKYSK